MLHVQPNFQPQFYLLLPLRIARELRHKDSWLICHNTHNSSSQGVVNAIPPPLTHVCVPCSMDSIP